MIVDASALLAILFDEPEAEQFAALLAQAEAPRMSAVNYLEAAIRIDQQDSVVATQAFDAFIELSGIAIEPVTVEHTRLARRAYAMFGKGRHRAGLNFGDVFAYALAKSRQEPLLYKGNDFVHTDVTGAA
ncbi:type II toxin-antitoxin system VapC family toxin [Rhabdaerophilum sp. SD176]|uniref:type II toxin-antitoxin system VapC family toxin n=1 Tax=Rhabdaerophilum sp. SD176 TaxID=2983548 RepID=UPI0024DFC2BF|nr:type II toxin-antitoxin system VapC family toxin [Rhabdaerophilum sp. SD176]